MLELSYNKKLRASHVISGRGQSDVIALEHDAELAKTSAFYL